MNYRLPNITATDPQGQVQQLKSYLYQLVGELNYAADQTEQAIVRSSNNQNAKSAGQVKSPAESFAEVKALIIKSADIISSYTDSIGKNLQGWYVAQSEFGTYSEKTASDIEANAKAIQQTYTDIQEIQNILSVNAYIRTGLLDYDEQGAPIYGVEVGQRTEVDGEDVFNKYARFTSGKLSFYDANDNEVAYFSDNKLYVANVEVIGSYRIGRLVDTALGDGSVITKYIGG